MTVSYKVKRHRTTPDLRIACIAKGQHGVLSRAQALRCGATAGAIEWRLRVGRWESPLPGVYKVAGAPTTWRQPAMAACLSLGPRAVASFRAAAALRNFPGIKRATVEVTVPRNRHRIDSSEIIVHTTRELPEEDVTTIDGIPVTKPARTLLDLATVEPEAVIERCLEDLLRRRLVSLSFLERWLRDPRRRRHPGRKVLQRLVAARATVGVTESPLETDVLKLLQKAGLPIPMLQYVVEDQSRFVARLDFAYPDACVAIEADGFRHHDGRQAFDSDRARRNELQALGWNVLRITSQHLAVDPAGVVHWVRRALANA
jgi:REase_MTES_1575/AbiEi antitoxin C-terminal domain